MSALPSARIAHAPASLAAAAIAATCNGAVERAAARRLDRDDEATFDRRQRVAHDVSNSSAVAGGSRSGSRASSRAPAIESPTGSASVAVGQSSPSRPGEGVSHRDAGGEDPAGVRDGGRLGGAEDAAERGGGGGRELLARRDEDRECGTLAFERRARRRRRRRRRSCWSARRSGGSHAGADRASRSASRRPPAGHRRSAAAVVLAQRLVEPCAADRVRAARVTEQRSPAVDLRPALAVAGGDDSSGAGGDHGAGSGTERAQVRGIAVAGDRDPRRAELAAEALGQPAQLAGAQRLEARRGRCRATGRPGSAPSSPIAWRTGIAIASALAAPSSRGTPGPVATRRPRWSTSAARVCVWPASTASVAGLSGLHIQAGVLTCGLVLACADLAHVQKAVIDRARRRSRP